MITLVRVETRADFLDQLEKFKPTLIISDYDLPTFDGIAAVELLRTIDHELPFILVSGYIGEERATEALKKGATDFLVKSSISGRLVPVIRRAILEVQALADRKRMETQLRHAQKMEAVGQLAGGISHDFNNLLMVIIGSLELLQDQVPADGPAQSLVATALRATNRGADLTRKLLSFSRQQRLQYEICDVGKLLTEMTGMLRRTLGQTIEVETIIPSGTWRSQLDASEFENAVLNLSINARDAMPNGGKLIIELSRKRLDDHKIAGHVDVKPGEYIMVAVSDTGVGIPQQLIERVFEPFFTTKESGKGTGLGLAMVYGFIKQANGYVDVFSEEGRGTTMKLYLPFIADREVAQPGEMEGIGPSIVDESATILFVDDDDDVRQIGISILGQLNCRVISAANGAQALELLKKHDDINVLLTDVIMPGGMNGLELAAEATRRRPSLKVIFCSGYAESAAVGRTPLPEKAAFLNKPYGKMDLASHLRRILH